MRRFTRLVFALLAASILHPAAKAQKAPTLEQFLSAPFPSELTAAPAKGRVAWVFNAQGARNVWISEPAADGSYKSRQLTSYKEDDGQDVGQLSWAPDGETIVYTRGGDLEFLDRPNPNPTNAPEGVEQNVWAMPLSGGAPKKIGDGHSPAVSPKGGSVAFLAKGQIWFAKLDGSEKAEQLVHSNGDSGSLRWSPDGAMLAFTSHRNDHTFIGVYDIAAKSLHYLDPSVDTDREPVWSPDSRRIAFIRIPVSKGHLPFNPRREGEPWSIRIADVTTGRSQQIWRADAGPGSVFHEAEAENQLIWAAGDRIVFPWERTGWLHLYSVAVNGGPAKLLTPGNFEVEYVSASENRQQIVYSSNQDDIDRRHVWRVSPTADRPEAVTSGTGIETAPVIASDNRTVLVLRSDPHTTLRPALAPSNAKGDLRDLAPESLPADFPANAMVAPLQVVFSGADGMQIHAQLFLPPNLNDGAPPRNSNDGAHRNPSDASLRNASYITSRNPNDSALRNSNDGTRRNPNDASRLRNVRYAPRLNASYNSPRNSNDASRHSVNDTSSRNVNDASRLRNVHHAPLLNAIYNSPRNSNDPAPARNSNDGARHNANDTSLRNANDASLRNVSYSTGRNPHDSALRSSNEPARRNPNDTSLRNVSYSTGRNPSDSAPRTSNHVAPAGNSNNGAPARGSNDGPRHNANDTSLRNVSYSTGRNPSDSAPRTSNHVAPAGNSNNGAPARGSNDETRHNANDTSLRNVSYSTGRNPNDSAPRTSNHGTSTRSSNDETRHNANDASRHPALVFFHGGSRRQMLLGWHYMLYYSNAYAMNQYLASRGYIVLAVNYRSGIGYGMNFREALNYGAAGASEFNDVLGAGLYLRSRPDVDPARIGLWGGSYGGYLTALGLARSSDLYAAGVDMHGVHDWNLEIPTFAASYRPGERTDVARLAWESSPLAAISTWRSPVLLVHGDDDRNVPFSQTVDLVQALRKQGVEFEELIFPDEIHDFLLHRSWLAAYHASSDFFDKHFKMPEK